jgi:hypothetical protein
VIDCKSSWEFIDEATPLSFSVRKIFDFSKFVLLCSVKIEPFYFVFEPLQNIFSRNFAGILRTTNIRYCNIYLPKRRHHNSAHLRGVCLQGSRGLHRKRILLIPVYLLAREKLLFTNMAESTLSTSSASNIDPSSASLRKEKRKAYLASRDASKGFIYLMSLNIGERLKKAKISRVTRMSLKCYLNPIKHSKIEYGEIRH